MVIVKMNNTTVECSIAASELREIGLTPEAIMNGEKKSVPFMAQLNREVGEQLGFNPETEVLMMSKNMMVDGSVRIFAIKMSNEDIQKSADRIRGSAEAILKEMTQERVDAIKQKMSAGGLPVPPQNIQVEPDNPSPSNSAPKVIVVEQTPEEEPKDLSIESMYKERIIEVLKKYPRNRKAAAEELGISERTLYRKIKEYGIDLKKKKK